MVPERGQLVWYPNNPRGNRTGRLRRRYDMACKAHPLEILEEPERSAPANLLPGREVVGDHDNPRLIGFDHRSRSNVMTLLTFVSQTITQTSRISVNSESKPGQV